MKPPFALGLREAAAAITTGTLSSVDLVASCLDRIRLWESRVQAWVHLDEAGALRAARAADRRRGAQSSRVDALPGIPVGIKDIIDVAGMPTRMGSPIYADHWPRASARLVERLARSGAIPLGKAVTTEFAFMAPSRTRNPWNAAHTPGGSSSGSAAAVACGMVPAALGTQTNGSVIRPAAFCGVVGYKPGKGRISIEGVLPFSTTLDQPGVFARSVSDAALLASWITDQASVISHDIAVAKTAPCLYAVRSPVWDRTEPAQRQRFDADIAALRAGGADVRERELPPAFADAHRVHRTIMLAEAARAAHAIRLRHRDGISETLNRALDEGEGIRDATYQEALDARSRLIEAFTAFVDDGRAAVITPPAAGEAPQGLEATGDPAFCTIWTLLGTPAITIPTGLGPRGLPLGLQIVARPLESNYLLAVAAWCERHLPFAGLIPGE
ncbi:MAG: amidase [Burkholderiales bacterium]